MGTLSLPSVTFPPRTSAIAMVALVTLLATCDDSRVTEPDECDPLTGIGCTQPPAPACEGNVPTGRTCVLWRAADGPRTIVTADTFDILRIEAGSEVRVAPGITLAARQLVVEGTAAAPVRFLPLSAGQAWSGIGITGSAGDTSLARHVRIEGAVRGIDARAPVVIENAHVAGGVSLYGGSIVRSAVTGGGVHIRSNSNARIEDTVIRDAPGHGIDLRCIRCWAIISAGTIENNGGDGVHAPSGDPRSPSVIFERPARITGNGGRPLVVPLSALQGAMSEVDAQQMILGNAVDSVIAYSAFTWGSQHVTPGDITWRSHLPGRIVLSCPAFLPAMTMEAGATLTLQGGCPGPPGLMHLPRLLGDAAQPVHLAGAGASDLVNLSISSAGADTARVQHARFRGVRLIAADQPAVLEHVTLDSASIVLRAAGSRLANVTSHAGGRHDGPFAYQQEAALTVAADAIIQHTRIEGALHHGLHVTAGTARLADCSIRASAAHGILVEQGTARVQWCSLESNTGYAIHNATPDTILAPNVWWGDPAGPRGPDGDGIDGPVMLQPLLSAPHVVGTGRSSSFFGGTSRPLVHIRPWITAPHPVETMLGNIEKL